MPRMRPATMLKRVRRNPAPPTSLPTNPAYRSPRKSLMTKRKVLKKTSWRRRMIN